MKRYQIHNVSYGDLRARSRPQAPNQPEAFADTLYDTQTYLDNSSVALTFFGAAQPDLTLGNIGAGSLPDGQYFSIDHISLDAWADAGWVTTAAGGVTGAADDLGLLLYQGRPTLTLTLNNKPYGPWPLLAAGGSGGVDVFGWGTFTAEESLQTGQVRVGGMFVGQSIVIPPLVSFRAVVNWSAAQNLTDDYRLRLSFVGTRYRPVQ